MNRLHTAPLAALLAAAIVAGCASAPPPAPPRDPNLAAITVYRLHSDLHQTDYPYVYVDKENKGQLTDAGTVNFDATAGIHGFSLSNPALWESAQSWQLKVVGGKHYFFRLTLGEAEGPQGSLARYISRFARVDEVSAAAAQADFDSVDADLQSVFAYVKESRGWSRDIYKVLQRENEGALLVFWVVYKDDDEATPGATSHSFVIHVDADTHKIVGGSTPLVRKRS